MKQLNIMAILLAAAVSFGACGDDDEPEMPGNAAANGFEYGGNGGNNSGGIANAAIGIDYGAIKDKEFTATGGSFAVTDSSATVLFSVNDTMLNNDNLIKLAKSMEKFESIKDLDNDDFLKELKKTDELKDADMAHLDKSCKVGILVADNVDLKGEGRFYEGKNVVGNAYKVYIDELQAATDDAEAIKLKPGKKYYYCAAMSFAGELVLSKANSFTTEPNAIVDLGLSVKWAMYNIGTCNPVEAGDYYAWGETETKTVYSYSNSAWSGVCNSEMLNDGVINDDFNLTGGHDAAKARLGGAWRLPTYSELNELMTQCDWALITDEHILPGKEEGKFETKKVIWGYKVTGKNGNSIFLPLSTGYYSESALQDGTKSINLWSATPCGNDEAYGAWSLVVEDNGNKSIQCVRRHYGCAIRPVVQ